MNTQGKIGLAIIVIVGLIGVYSNWAALNASHQLRMITRAATTQR